MYINSSGVIIQLQLSIVQFILLCSDQWQGSRLTCDVIACASMAAHSTCVLDVKEMLMLAVNVHHGPSTLCSS
jgi:hypothetical protein